MLVHPIAPRSRPESAPPRVAGGLPGRRRRPPGVHRAGSVLAVLAALVVGIGRSSTAAAEDAPPPPTAAIGTSEHERYVVGPLEDAQATTAADAAFLAAAANDAQAEALATRRHLDEQLAAATDETESRALVHRAAEEQVVQLEILSAAFEKVLARRDEQAAAVGRAIEYTQFQRKELQRSVQTRRKLLDATREALEASSTSAARLRDRVRRAQGKEATRLEAELRELVAEHFATLRQGQSLERSVGRYERFTAARQQQVDALTEAAQQLERRYRALARDRETLRLATVELQEAVRLDRDFKATRDLLRRTGETIPDSPDLASVFANVGDLGDTFGRLTGELSASNNTPAHDDPRVRTFLEGDAALPLLPRPEAPPTTKPAPR